MHKATVCVVVAETGRGGEVRQVGVFENRPEILTKLAARLHRAGELTAIWVPDAAQEAMRDPVRARATAGRVLSKARQHLQGFLPRHGQIYQGVRT